MAPTLEQLQHIVELTKEAEERRLERDRAEAAFNEVAARLAEAYRSAGLTPTQIDNGVELSTKRRSGVRVSDLALRFLSEHPDRSVTPEELAKELGPDVLVSSLHTALNRLVREKRLKRVGNKQYAYGEPPEEPSDPDPEAQ